jgi:hypothetical protein
MLLPEGERGCYLRGLSLRHLQIHPCHVHEFERLGLEYLGDFVEVPDLELESDRLGASLIRRHAELAARHLSDTGLDWVSFWGEEEISLHWMAMDFAGETFGESVLKLPLKHLSGIFGALLNIPRAEGLETLGDLFSVYKKGSAPWRGFGARKVARLGNLLQDIAEKGIELPVSLQVVRDSANPVLPEDVLAWSIDALGLGAGAIKLRRNAYRTLASLQVQPSKLWTLPGVGRQTISLARSRMSLLAEALEEGEVNLDRLAELQGLEIIPAKNQLEGGDLFDPLSSVLRAVAEADGSDAALLILEHRICIGGSDEATLEDIADMLPVRITRERVRQIEKRILQTAATLLLSPFPVLGTVIVRPILKERFRDLAKALEEREQIGPEELAVLISTEWKCDLVQAVRVLPMVMAVIEGTARTFAELRRLLDSPAHYLRSLDTIAGRWSAQNIGAERGLALKLESLAIRNLEDLRLAWIGGCDFGRHETYVRCVLDATGRATTDAVTLAERLAEMTRRPVVPLQRKKWSDYVASIPEDVAAVISAGTFWSDAELIFKQRTSALPNERITMDALGERLGRLGVTVKRTETDTLMRLASAILKGQEGYAQCIFRPDWLALWHELGKIHERFADDQKSFRRSIEQLYGVEEEVMTMSMPSIWAILTGLPTRQSYGRSRIENGPRLSTLSPVRLAGFRTVH